MNYQEAIDVLYTKLPMFQRIGPSAYKANLDGAKAVCSMLGNPEKDLKFVHIAGTNGKGTVAHMLSAILQTSGYKVGLFTSPHLVDFRERIRINGEMIAEIDVIDFVESYYELWDSPSFFELTFGMALKHFSSSKVDIVILETGMGGRLDSTNIIPSAEVCVITNIGFDHQQFLGTTIREIAGEKAGILKHGVPVILGKMRPEAQSVVLEHALKMSSEVYYGRFEPDGLNDDLIPCFKENAATAYEAARVLKLHGWNIDENSFIESLNNYRSISGQSGRGEVIPASADLGSLIVDCAHNIDGIKTLMSNIKGKLHIIFGTVSDKDPIKVLELIPKNSVMYWCAAEIVRAMDVDKLSGLGASVGLNGRCYGSVSEAVEAARMATCNIEGEQALVCGSIFVVGEAL
tara:strand:- start:123 stop:1334 length:1212 start_codon:yes stop_codon:yes gene_type:complete